MKKLVGYLVPAATAVLLLAACNGGEDFGSPIAGFIYDPTRPDPNFDPSNQCAPRTIGLLQADFPVANIGYTCGGFHGYSGQVGLDDEREANYFVCPMASKAVTFYVGGETQSVDLGQASFRYTESVNIDRATGRRICEFDENLPDGGDYVQGRYDADGPYLLAIADLFDSPVRSDVISDGLPNETRAQNITAFLTGLDGDPADSVISIDQVAHEQIYDGFTSKLTEMLAEDFFDDDFATFVANNGDADTFLQEVATAGGAVGTLPVASADAERTLVKANGATAAGIYRIDMFNLEYFTLYLPGIFDEFMTDNYILTDYLSSLLLASTTDDDLEVAAAIGEFVPFVVVDRRQRMLGGGAFDVVDMSAATLNSGAVDGLTHLCDDNPLYMALDDSSTLLTDLRFSNKTFETLDSEITNGAAEFEIPGRFIQGKIYSGVAVDGFQNDYILDYNYANPPHAFNESEDQTRFSSTSLCGVAIDEQVPLGYARQGLVQPTLDRDVMNALFATPGQYQLVYTSRNPGGAGDDELTDFARGTLDITIHEDGTILTDKSGGSADGNPGYDATSDNPVIPAGELVIGMVSSLFPGTDDPDTVGEDESVTEADINIVIFNLADASAELTLPMYGSHFRARLAPDFDCDGDNRLFLPGSDTDQPFWYNPKLITDWYRATASPSENDQDVAGRTRAYGVVAGIDTTCP